MTVKEVLKALGSWDIKLKGTVPRDVLDAIDHFGHVAIVPGRLDPAQYGDNLLDIARYVGVVRTKTIGDDGRTNAPNDNISVSGPGMAMWLGDEDGKGSIYENAITPASASFATTINMLLPASGAGSVTAGTIYSVAGTYTGRHIYETPRTAINYVCDTMSTTSIPVAWRVNGDGTLDAGPESNLFVTNPTCVIVSRDAGEDMTMRALPGSMDVTRDVEDYTTRIVLLAEGEGSSIVTGAANVSPATAYKDIHGGALKMTRLVSESDTSTGNASTRAQLQLSKYTTTRNALQLSTADYDVHGTFQVGDRVWVYNPEAGLVDTTNEIVFRGQRLNPMKLQVTETSWSITAGYTVAYRAANGTWTDLTDHVDFETDGTASVTVGDFSRQLSATGTEPIGSRPNVDTSVPGIPTLLPPFSGAAYLDSKGFTRSRAILSWNAPNNVDGSTILDGDHFEIRYAVDTDMLYPATWAQLAQVRWMDLQTWGQPFAAPDGNWLIVYVPWGTSTVQLQDLSTGIGYDVQIRAVDKSGNAGAWSGTTTFVATSDNIPPSAPAAPTVAGSRIAVQVTHTLGKSSGGTYNLESDLHHLEIHVDYEPHFTPSSTTLKGKASATAGMIQAQIPVVATVQVEETTARYVRVVAVDIAGNKSNPSDAATATALLIDDAHISDLTVTKVTAGTISADWIVGARIKTADTGPRVELNSAGLQAYNAGGTQTVDVDSATGDVTILGQLISGISGKRLEINPTATYLPEIRFYASSGSNFAYINAISGGTDSSLGLNGSAFDDGGVDVYNRVLLGSDIAQYEVVRQDTQARRGGYMWHTTSGVFAGYNSAGSEGGTMGLFATEGTVGWDNGGANENRMKFDSSGVTRHIGKWRNYVSADSNEGLFAGTISSGSAISGITLTWGPTMDSPMYPVAMLRDSPANYGYMSGTPSTTSASIDFAIATTGASAIQFWCWRM